MCPGTGACTRSRRDRSGIRRRRQPEGSSGRRRTPRREYLSPPRRSASHP